MIGIPGVGKAADLIAKGLTRSAIEHAYRTGQIVRVRRGIYCDRRLWDKSAANAADRHAIEIYAAWLAIGKRGWASGYSAALLNELPVPKGQPDVTELSVVPRARGQRSYPGLRVRAASRLHDGELVVARNVPCASRRGAHSTSPEKKRQMRIEEAGFVVVRWTPAEAMYEPHTVLDRIVRQSKIASKMFDVPTLSFDPTPLVR